ncbi:MAG: C4-dicarboxylic acid transporter DauA, partial [Deltaproteobacteria bacterium]|nr:C4-dicarboxylic acid transporter DauA [Deltaproteobacteria bacterium]
MALTRYQSSLAGSRLSRLPAAALRAVWREGYTRVELKRDVLAGLVVGLVALPLAMALAIGVGVPPQHGLYTAIVAGSLTAVLGGSRVQVTGPTAAFVAVLVPVSAHFGLGSLLLATVMAGVLLVILGVSGMGRLVEFVPFPVTTGFTAGIAVVIATLQLPDFLGLTVTRMPEQYLSKLGALLAALPTMRPAELVVGLVTLAVLIVWPRWSRRIPAPLVAIVVGGVFAYVLALAGSNLEVPTINSRFTYEVDGVTRAGIPRMPPQPVLPWRMPGPDGQPLVLGF